MAASLSQKAAYLQRVLAPWSAQLQPLRSVPDAGRLRYRDRVTLTARWDPAGWRFGLMRRDELIAIHECPVHTPRVNRLVELLRRSLPAHESLPVAYLHVAGGQATLVVKRRDYAADELASVRDGLAATGVEGLWVHCHPAAGRRLFARSGWHLDWGLPRSRDASGLEHGPAAFQQLLPALHAESVDIACAHLAPAPEVAVVDLYCGVGTTLRRWRAAGAAALGVELAGAATECASRNAPGATVLRGTCEQRLPQVQAWWQEQAAAQRVCYANPPRSGLEPAVRAALGRELQPERIAYLACSAGTLARDLAEFEAAGLRVEAIVPFDFFPRTHHVECLALLRRR